MPAILTHSGHGSGTFGHLNAPPHDSQSLATEMPTR
jgi:hypothetical protein